MRPNSSSAFLTSLILHGFVAALIFCTTIYLARSEKAAPVIFELVAGPGNDGLAADLEAHDAFEHVEIFVLALMDMQRRRFAMGHPVIDDRKAVLGLIGAGAEIDQRVAEPAKIVFDSLGGGDMCSHDKSSLQVSRPPREIRRLRQAIGLSGVEA